MRYETEAEKRAHERWKKHHPIVCHECGDVCEHYGSILAEEAGWTVDRATPAMKVVGSKFHRERVGHCPSCKEKS